MRHVYAQITEAAKQNRKLFIVLIDPDKCAGKEQIAAFATLLAKASPDFIFVGGSHTTESIAQTIKDLKANCNIPLVLFPGNALQFTPEADALLFLSLLSGRNSDFLIGQHVIIAPAVKKSCIETISTGYILVESDHATAVEYISNTRPIPRKNPQLAATTAIAGELLGSQMIYLEAGSGAYPPVPSEMISQVKQSITIPLIVGGGLRNKVDILVALRAGADAIVVGNVLETSPELMIEFAETVHQF